MTSRKSCWEDKNINPSPWQQMLLHEEGFYNLKIIRLILFCLYVLFFRSLCAGSDAPYTGDDERNAQYLSHIHRQTCLECYLNLLGIFDEETEGEDESKAKTEIETGANALRTSLLIDEEDEEEKQKYAKAS